MPAFEWVSARMISICMCGEEDRVAFAKAGTYKAFLLSALALKHELCPCI